jgi:hypothetical protein
MLPTLADAMERLREYRLRAPLRPPLEPAASRRAMLAGGRRAGGAAGAADVGYSGEARFSTQSTAPERTRQTCRTVAPRPGPRSLRSWR